MLSVRIIADRGSGSKVEVGGDSMVASSGITTGMESVMGLAMGVVMLCCGVWVC